MKPILFNTDMVRAILDGRKTMTRRVIKPQPQTIVADDRNRSPLAFWVDNDKWIKPPYQVGDILYVRETWAKELSDEQDEKHPFKDGSYIAEYATGEDYEFYGYVYKADTPNAKYPCNYPDDYEGAPTWRPSIHMPKEAARIWLEVTDVRVERLQEITYDDCLSEGMWDYGTDVDTLAAFQELWQSLLNAKKGYGWDENPWVWVYEFKRVEVTP